MIALSLDVCLLVVVNLHYEEVKAHKKIFGKYVKVKILKL